MAKYPGTPAKYPSSPNKYPGSGAKLFPGSSSARYPIGLETINIQQSFVVNSSMATLGVINVQQSFSVAGELSYASYSPLSEGGGLVWFDMLDSGAYTESGGTVTALVNKASAVSWSAVSSCPFEATGLNGHPCLHPVDITDYFLSTEAAVVSALDCPTTAKPYTLIWYGSPDTTTTGGCVFGVGNSGVASASTRTWGHRPAVNQYEYLQTAPASVSQVRSTAGIVVTTPQMCMWNSPGTGQAFSLNDGALDPDNLTVTPAYTPGTGPNRAALFCRPDSAPDTTAIMRLGEFLLFDNKLSAAAITRIYNYLAARWA